MKVKQWLQQVIVPGESEISFATDNGLIIDIKGDGYACAKLKGRGEYITEKSTCCVCADFSIESDGNECKFIPVLVQYGKDGKRLAGDYFDIRGNINISVKLTDETEYIELEFLLYSFGNAKLILTEPEISFEETEKPRVVNVATAYFKRPYTSEPEDIMKNVERILKAASEDEVKPDIICFTETTYDRGLVNVNDKKWISDDSEPVKRICDMAVKYGMYVIYSIHELDGERKYNTALVISDKGEIVGKYRKTHLTYDEVEAGINPGSELPVFELPFGKIGIMICWDQWFPGVAQTLFKKGAEIIFVPTAGNPIPVYCSRAYENGGYIVVSGCHDFTTEASCIVSQQGEIMAAVESVEKGYAVAAIDLNEKKYVDWLSFEKGYGANLYPVDLRKEFLEREGTK